MKIAIQILALLILVSLSACGGGGSDGVAASPPPPPPPPPPIGGIGRTGFALGPVATFGSIVVNGVRYDTSAAIFTIDGTAGQESDLNVGDVVTVKGTIDDNGTTGTADDVAFDDVVTGPVDSVDIVGSSLVVLGQNVRVSPETSFDDSFVPSSLDGVTVGQIVEVSGQIDANDDIIATRIEPKPAGTLFEAHGTVSNLDANNTRFNLRSLVVDYSSALITNFPGGQIAEGDYVEAKGPSLNAAGELAATSVEFESLVPNVNDGDRIEIEGFITRFVSPQDFDVAGLPVTTTTSTVFEGGTEADLGLNIKIEAEGDVDSAGTLVATKIDIRRTKSIRATANVDSVNSANNSLVVLGIVVSVDDLTRLEDKSNAEVDPLTISDINAGDYVEVRGDEFPAGSGIIVAALLEREDPDTEAVLQGFVESFGSSSYSVLGVTIDTNGATVFFDENDIVMSSTDFFNRLAVNSLVKAKGTEVSDATITAEEVEFELEF